MSYRPDKLVIATHTHTHGHTDPQTQAMTIPEGQNWPRVKTTFIGGMELVSLRCNRDFTSASSYGLSWYKYAIATQWYQFHTTDAWWFSLNISTLLTHWGRVTHICVSDLTSIGSDNGLSPGRRQAIIRTNGGILLIRPLGTNFSEFFCRNSNIFIQENVFESIVCEKAAILSRPQWVNEGLKKWK